MDYCIHGRIGFCEFCNSEMEGIENRMTKLIVRTERDEEAKKRWAEDLRVDRLPYWLHPEADYSCWDAGMWPDEED